MVYTLFFPSVAKRVTEESITMGDSLFEVIAKFDKQFNRNFTVDFVFKYIPDKDFSLPDDNDMILFFIDGTTLTGNGYMITLYNNGGVLQIKVKYDSGSGWTDAIIVDVPMSTDRYKNGYYVVFQHERKKKRDKELMLHVTEFIKDSHPEFKTSADISGSSTISGVVTSSFTQFGFGAPSITNLRYGIEVDGNGQLKDLPGYYIGQNIALVYFRLWGKLVPINASSDTYGLFNSMTFSDKEHSIYYLIEQLKLLPEPPVGDSGTIPDLEFQLNVPQNVIPFVNPDADPQTNISNRSKKSNLDESVDVLATIIKSNSNSYQTLDNFVINANTTIISFEQVNCILRGTKILTVTGYVPIENVKVGDFIVTHDGREKEVIKTYHLSAMHSQDTQCIIIKKGTFGAIEDLYISKNHAILIGNEFITPYGKSDFEGTFELVKDKSHYTYYSLMTDDFLADSLVANGVPIETWGGYKPGVKRFRFHKPIPKSVNNNRLLIKPSTS